MTTRPRLRALAVAAVAAGLVPGVAACSKETTTDPAKSASASLNAVSSSLIAPTGSATASDSPTTSSDTSTSSGMATSTDLSSSGTPTSTEGGSSSVAVGTDSGSAYCTNIKALSADMKKLGAASASPGSSSLKSAAVTLKQDAEKIRDASPDDDARAVWGAFGSALEKLANGDKDAMDSISKDKVLKSKANAVERDVKSRCGFDLNKLGE